MARDRILQIYRGTTAQNDAFTGAQGELTMDTARKEIRIHDGSTAGGNVVGLTPGFIAPFAGSTAPAGWLVCDGSAVSRTTYAKLFAVIGTTYGEGDGNSTFNLPKINTGDPVLGAEVAYVGQKTDGSLPNITGYFSPWGYQNQLEPSGVFYQTGTGTHAYAAGDAWVGSVINFDASRSSSVYTSGQTKVKSAGVYVMYCIKY